jgi:hypothetical protein
LCKKILKHYQYLLPTSNNMAFTTYAESWPNSQLSWRMATATLHTGRQGDPPHNWISNLTGSSVVNARSEPRHKRRPANRYLLTQTIQPADKTELRYQTAKRKS